MVPLWSRAHRPLTMSSAPLMISMTPANPTQPLPRCSNEFVAIVPSLGDTAPRSGDRKDAVRLVVAAPDRKVTDGPGGEVAGLRLGGRGRPHVHDEALHEAVVVDGEVVDHRADVVDRRPAEAVLDLEDAGVALGHRRHDPRGGTQVGMIARVEVPDRLTP